MLNSKQKLMFLSLIPVLTAEACGAKGSTATKLASNPPTVSQNVSKQPTSGKESQLSVKENQAAPGAKKATVFKPTKKKEAPKPVEPEAIKPVEVVEAPITSNYDSSSISSSSSTSGNEYKNVPDDENENGKKKEKGSKLNRLNPKNWFKKSSKKKTGRNHKDDE
jgi:hypothetical protein